MNIPQRLPRYDIIENELKISTQDIRFHAVRRTLPQRVRDQLSHDLWAGSTQSRFWALKIDSRNPTDKKMRT